MRQTKYHKALRASAALHAALTPETLEIGGEAAIAALAELHARPAPTDGDATAAVIATVLTCLVRGPFKRLSDDEVDIALMAIAIAASDCHRYLRQAEDAGDAHPRNGRNTCQTCGLEPHHSRIDCVRAASAGDPDWQRPSRATIAVVPPAHRPAPALGDAA